MSAIENAVSFMLGIANDSRHGYDQTNRWGPDYDCSSLVIHACQQAGIGVRDRGATYTGNMRAAFLASGFSEVTKSVSLATGAGLQRGDVLLNVKSHTAMYIGNGQLCHASGNERGGITGGNTGDQTGGEICVRSYYNFPWDHVLRYTADAGAAEPAPVAAGGVYTVAAGDSLWALAERFLGEGSLYPLIMRANGMTNTGLQVGRKLTIPDGEEKTAEPTAKGGPAPVCRVELRELRRGDMGGDVLALQTLLIHKWGLSCGGDGADGEYGEKTEGAVNKFLAVKGMPAAGIATTAFWAAVLEGTCAD